MTMNLTSLIWLQHSACRPNIFDGQLEKVVLRAMRGRDVDDNRFCINEGLVEGGLAALSGDGGFWFRG